MEGLGFGFGGERRVGFRGKALHFGFPEERKFLLSSSQLSV